MDSIQAIVVDHQVAEHLVIREVQRPIPTPSEALVRVHAISLNVGDIYRISLAESGGQLGWDLAGTVEQAAADGSGPKSGSRVAGLLVAPRFGAGAQLVAVPTKDLAEIPNGVSFAQAAALPTAGLTALYALERGGSLLHRNVLVTGASGGVGHFACQLAQLAGASVVGAVRQEANIASVKALGVRHIAKGADLSVAQQFGPYDLIIDVLGGHALAVALSSLLVPGGLCVGLGMMDGLEVTLNLGEIFMQAGNINLSTLVLPVELKSKAGAEGLARLMHLVAEERLHPLIGIEAPWTEITKIVQQFRDRRIPGKAVLHIS
ncbi:oxidoreductase [Reticulibacter mediterranei]|uniref:Oxidoreductase n=1 Tax=Reticulibacter mediterranei TaxID=2778369 RepID=A0A8J3ISJ9_9CHLR|nr:zinc-binding dehydrogenase [Reticulibacter mediterranei]GHO96135.1 oxidoreductase [Reticulibacter mediterranei]